jgi:hypothetical protein
MLMKNDVLAISGSRKSWMVSDLLQNAVFSFKEKEKPWLHGQGLEL